MNYEHVCLPLRLGVIPLGLDQRGAKLNVPRRWVQGLWEAKKIMLLVEV